MRWWFRFPLPLLLILSLLSACQRSLARVGSGWETKARVEPVLRHTPFSPRLPTRQSPVNQGEDALAIPPFSFPVTPKPTAPFAEGEGKAQGEDLLPVPPPYAELDQVAAQVWGASRLIQRIRIPRIGVDTQVVPVGWYLTEEGAVWESPGPYVGWAVNSVPPGEPGQIVLYGHNNIEGSIFRDLYRLQVDDTVVLTTGVQDWLYQVTEVLIVAVPDVQAERALYQTHLWQPQARTRLVLISCYPPDNNTHRVLVFARPVLHPAP